ncbi:MAG: TraB/GumN family protein [Pedobacter sp.]|nr:MAG: TraB/GumN family protein [Pedobacter sp.]
MKITKLTLILFLFVGFKSTAQTTKLANTLFWEISGKGLTKPSYIFGTYHFAGKNFLDSMTNVNQKLAASDMVIGELLFKDSLLTKKLAPFMLLEGTTLDQVLSEQEYKLVDDYLKKIAGFGLSNMKMLNPMAIQVMILQFTSPVTFTKENTAIDAYFQDYGQAHQKTVVGLETVEQQGEILFGASIERQKERLLDNVRNSEKYKKQAEEGFQAFKEQDLSKIAKSFKETTEFTKAESEVLLKNRNLDWVKKLPPLIKDKSAFIAVGVGHLIDKWGLINLLQEQGYTVKPIKTN